MVLHPAIYMKYKASNKAIYFSMVFSGMKLKGVYYYADEIRSIKLAPALIFCQSSARLLLVEKQKGISRFISNQYHVELSFLSMWNEKWVQFPSKISMQKVFTRKRR